MRRARRMICASHQRGARSARERFSLNAAPHGTCATRSVARMAEPCQRRSGADGQRRQARLDRASTGVICSRRGWLRLSPRRSAPLVRTGLCAAGDRARHRSLGVSAVPDGLGCARAHRRAAQAETVVECRRGLSRAGAGRHRARLLPEAKSRRRAHQLFRLDRPAARGDRDRKERCRSRHGAALAEAAGAGL